MHFQVLVLDFLPENPLAPETAVKLAAGLSVPGGLSALHHGMTESTKGVPLRIARNENYANVSAIQARTACLLAARRVLTALAARDGAVAATGLQD